MGLSPKEATSSKMGLAVSPEGAADDMYLSVVPIVFIISSLWKFKCLASAVSFALWVHSSAERCDVMPAALEAHAAKGQHEVRDAIGGEALPRSARPTSAVLLLTNVDLMSAFKLFVFVCSVCDGLRHVEISSRTSSPSKMGSTGSREEAARNVFVSVVAVGVSCPTWSPCL